MLLSQSVKHTKALQQLSLEKVALQKSLLEQGELLRASEAARAEAERRALELEMALRGVRSSAAVALGLEDGDGGQMH